MISQIIFNGKKSYTDFGVTLSYFLPQPPSLKIIKEDVPFMHGSYDFSLLYGEQAYNDRRILCRLQFFDTDKIRLYIKYGELLEWLIGSGTSRLEYTGEPGLYYMARVEEAPSWNRFYATGSLDFAFTAYPFKFGIRNEGTDIWDEFNFETDYMQDVKFNVVGTKNIVIYNPSSRKIVPTVVCDAAIDVVKGNITYKFSTGSTKDWRFELEKGKNEFTLKGNGNIEFVFRKEVL